MGLIMFCVCLPSSHFQSNQLRDIQKKKVDVLTQIKYQSNINLYKFFKLNFGKANNIFVPCGRESCIDCEACISTDDLNSQFHLKRKKENHSKWTSRLWLVSLQQYLILKAASRVCLFLSYLLSSVSFPSRALILHQSQVSWEVCRPFLLCFFKKKKNLKNEMYVLGEPCDTQYWSGNAYHCGSVCGNRHCHLQLLHGQYLPAEILSVFLSSVSLRLLFTFLN